MRNRLLILQTFILFWFLCLCSFWVNSLIFLLIWMEVKISKRWIQSNWFFINLKVRTFFLIAQIYSIKYSFKLDFLVFNLIRSTLSWIFNYFNVLWFMLIFNFWYSVLIFIWISSCCFSGFLTSLWNSCFKWFQRLISK